MREQWARRIVLLTGQMIFLMAVLFAVMQNPIEPADTTMTKEPRLAAELDPRVIEAGFQIYQQQTCARCHSIAGKGNPRNPLDGVGVKHDAQALRHWIIGADELHSILPERAFKIKQAYKELASDELDALVVAMQSLKPLAKNAGQPE